MKHTFAVKPALVLLLLLTAALSLTAQTYWDKIPAFTSECYDEKDAFVTNVKALRTEIREKMEKSKQAVEEKASKMTTEEKMAIAMRYQNMQPDEIVRMQNEMLEMTQAQADFQEKSAGYENRFNAIEEEFRGWFLMSHSCIRLQTNTNVCNRLLYE